MYTDEYGETFHDKEEAMLIDSMREATAKLYNDPEKYVLPGEKLKRSPMDAFYSLFERKFLARRQHKKDTMYNDPYHYTGDTNPRYYIGKRMQEAATDAFLSDHYCDDSLTELPEFKMFTDHNEDIHDPIEISDAYVMQAELWEETKEQEKADTVHDTIPRAIKLGDRVIKNMKLNKQIYQDYITKAIDIQPDIIDSVYEAIQEENKPVVIEGSDIDQIVAVW